MEKTEGRPPQKEDVCCLLDVEYVVLLITDGTVFTGFYVAPKSYSSSDEMTCL